LQVSYILADMGILIKRPEAEAKIRELAARTGEGITDAVERAVDERLARLEPPKRKGRVDWERLNALIAEVKALRAINEHLTDDEIIGYDEHGVPG
jgi:antitoxin VapB